MIGNMLGDEEICRLVSWALSNPVPGGAAVTYPSSPVSPRQRVAA
jgi:hypothetical protein